MYPKYTVVHKDTVLHLYFTDTHTSSVKGGEETKKQANDIQPPWSDEWNQNQTERNHKDFGSYTFITFSWLYATILPFNLFNLASPPSQNTFQCL